MSHDDEAKTVCQTPNAGVHGSKHGSRGDPDRQIQTEKQDTPAAPPLFLNLGRTVDRVQNASILHGTESVNLDSSRAGSSILQSARQVDIRGGNFNTAGTQLTINLTINVGEQRPEEDPQETIAGSSRDNITQNIHEEATSNRNDRDDSTSSTEPPVQKIYGIYYRHIGVNRRGSPLWVPSPNQVLPVGYRRDGTTIGDVGIITEFGSFDCLFNIYLPHNDPVNLLQVPDSFTPFAFSHRAIQKRSEFGANSHLSSPSVKKVRSGPNGITFESSASEGAILAMPCGSNSEDVASIFSLRKYLTTHAEAWYRHIITELGREVQNGDVRLVTGWDKTKAWGMATFSEPTVQREPLLLQFKPISQSNVGMAYGWDYSGSANARAGPGAAEIEELRMADPPQDGIQYNNQTLFVRTLNVTFQDSTWNKLACDVGLFESHDGPGSTSNTSYSQFSRESRFSTSDSNASNLATKSENGGYNSTSRGATSIQLPALRRALAEHPSKGINEMLLKFNPTAKMAITDDHDWISVIRDDDTILPSAETLRERIMTSHIVWDEGGIISLQKKPVSESPNTTLKSPSLDLNKDDESTSLSPLLIPRRVALGLSSLATFYIPGSSHRNPPFSTHIPRGASSGGHGGTRNIKNDPDTEQNFGGFPSTFGSNSTGPAFTPRDGRNQLYSNQMFSQHHGGYSYGQELNMDGMTQALDDSANFPTKHPSPGSEGFSSDSSDEEILPSVDRHIEHPQSLPSHEQTESYLRQNLSISPPKQVNLNALPDEPFGTRIPKITELIKLAIWGSPGKKLTLRQIYDAIETRYPSWKTASDKPWQRSIRHNLSSNAIFVRVERPVDQPGKGCYWALDVRQGEGNKRNREDPVGGSRSSASDDSDSDEGNPTRGQSGPSMAPSDMQMSRANTSPLMGLPQQVEHYSQMRGGGPIIARHGYAAPIPPRHGNPPGYNAPPPKARRPASDISLERDTEETGRSSQRHRAH